MLLLMVWALLLLKSLVVVLVLSHCFEVVVPVVVHKVLRVAEDKAVVVPAVVDNTHQPLGDQPVVGKVPVVVVLGAAVVVALVGHNKTALHSQQLIVAFLHDGMAMVRISGSPILAGDRHEEEGTSPVVLLGNQAVHMHPPLHHVQPEVDMGLGGILQQEHNQPFEVGSREGDKVASSWELEGVEAFGCHGDEGCTFFRGCDFDCDFGSCCEMEIVRKVFFYQSFGCCVVLVTLIVIDFGNGFLIDALVTHGLHDDPYLFVLP